MPKLPQGAGVHGLYGVYVSTMLSHAVGARQGSNTTGGGSSLHSIESMMSPAESTQVAVRFRVPTPHVALQSPKGPYAYVTQRRHIVSLAPMVKPAEQYSGATTVQLPSRATPRLGPHPGTHSPLDDREVPVGQSSGGDATHFTPLKYRPAPQNSGGRPQRPLGCMIAPGGHAGTHCPVGDRTVPKPQGDVGTWGTHMTPLNVRPEAQLRRARVHAPVVVFSAMPGGQPATHVPLDDRVWPSGQSMGTTLLHCTPLNTKPGPQYSGGRPQRPVGSRTSPVVASHPDTHVPLLARDWPAAHSGTHAVPLYTSGEVQGDEVVAPEATAAGARAHTHTQDQL